MKSKLKKLVFAMFAIILPITTEADEADSILENTNPLEVIEECLQAISSGQDISHLAESLSKMSGLNLVPDERFRGMKCLSTYFGEAFYFDIERLMFISDSEEKERLRPELEEKAELERKLAERRDFLERMEAEEMNSAIMRKVEYQKRLLEACDEKLIVDPFLALTQPLCAEIFLSNGFRN